MDTLGDLIRLRDIAKPHVDAVRDTVFATPYDLQIDFIVMRIRWDLGKYDVKPPIDIWSLDPLLELSQGAQRLIAGLQAWLWAVIPGFAEEYSNDSSAFHISGLLEITQSEKGVRVAIVPEGESPYYLDQVAHLNGRPAEFAVWNDENEIRSLPEEI